MRAAEITVGTVLVALGGLIASCGAAMGVVEIAWYLKIGTWGHHSLSWAVGMMPETIWPKLNELLAWLSDRPLWGIITFSGLSVALLGSSLE